jgi:Bacterial Ig-like domain (group 3)/FG-GAP-like repeat
MSASLSWKNHLFLLATIFFPFAFSAQAQSPIFPVTGFYPATSSAMAIGDFNGDGKQDLAYIAPSQGSALPKVVVLLNQGFSTPISVETSTVSCTAQNSLVTADFNNDNKADLALTCAEGYVVILLGNGDGSFQAPTTFAVPGATALAPAVDLNGDGYLDVALISTTAAGPGNVVVLLNRGSGAPGALASPTSYPASDPLSSITIGDFNGDGKQDILAAGTRFAIFYGNGDGTLKSQPIGTAQAIEHSAFVAADLNRDGITDIAWVTEWYSGTPPYLMVMMGAKNGNFTIGPLAMPLPPSTDYTALVPAGTTNGGRNVNLALVGPSTTILLGSGNGGFTIGPSYMTPGPAAAPEVDSNGITNLVFSSPNGFSTLLGNGDGTFQGIPSLTPGPANFAPADINGDGLTDLVYMDAFGDLFTALGRGNGTFGAPGQTVGTSNGFLVTGDFDADGKSDVVAIAPGGIGPNGYAVTPEAELLFYKSNGDGSLQSAHTLVLNVARATNAVVGDFNGDGNLDVVVSYLHSDSSSPTSSGLVFVPGNGDGTFGTPVSFAQQSSAPIDSALLTADLNSDKKTDLIWNGSVYLGNSNGTFPQTQFGLTGSPVALGDLNGDGNADVLVNNNAYAGNGDGTFQTSPFYTATLPQNTTTSSATIGDVNADGNADLLLQYSTATNTTATAVFLGDGKGNFTADSNPYYTSGPNAIGPVLGQLARLNGNAPQPPNDNALDYLVISSSSVTSLINQINPTPPRPASLPSTTRLISSANSAAPTQQIILTAAVTGLNPSGLVTFTSGSTTLGTAPIVNGGASLTVSFQTAGTYTVMASYPGDSNNQPSSATATISVALVQGSIILASPSTTVGAKVATSIVANVLGISPTGTVTFSLAGGTPLGTTNVVNGTATFYYVFPAVGSYSIVASYSGDIANLPSSSSTPLVLNVVATDFYFTAAGTVGTVPAGGAVTTTLSIIPTYGYNGTVKFSCSGLTAGESCTFTPPTVTPTNALGGSTNIVVSTSGPYVPGPRTRLNQLQPIALTGILCLIFSTRRARQLHRAFVKTSLFALLLAAILISASGCGSSSQQSSSTPDPVRTPAGTQTIIVTAADTNGGPSHTVSLQLTVQ